MDMFLQMWGAALVFFYFAFLPGAGLLRRGPPEAVGRARLGAVRHEQLAHGAVTLGRYGGDVGEILGRCGGDSSSPRRGDPGEVAGGAMRLRA